MVGMTFDWKEELGRWLRRFWIGWVIKRGAKCLRSTYREWRSGLRLAISKACTMALAGPSHNSARAGSIRSRHTFGSSGPPGHQRLSVFRQTSLVF
jgi:hypothetical protein